MHRSFKRIALVLSAIVSGLTLIPSVRAQENPQGPPAEHIVQFAGRALVGEDGNGALAARFPTTVEGEAVQYMLLVENGCRGENAPPNAPEACPGVDSISISLDDKVVFATANEFEVQRVEIALNPVGGAQNNLVATVGGEAGSGARVAVLAIRPALVAVGGRSLLPWAWTDPLTRTFLTIHNAGPSPMAVRIVFFNPDGSTAGMSAARMMPVHATANLDLLAIATNLGINWTRGAVHVRWAARNFSRMSSVASEVHRELDESGNAEVTNARELALDDYGPFPINARELQEIFGETQP